MPNYKESCSHFWTVGDSNKIRDLCIFSDRIREFQLQEFSIRSNVSRATVHGRPVTYDGRVVANQEGPDTHNNVMFPTVLCPGNGRRQRAYEHKDFSFETAEAI